jgi:hypothetical protein
MTPARAYPPPVPTRQVASPWRVDECGNFSREIRAVEITGLSPRDELSKLRLRLANSENRAALQAVRAAADDLVARVNDDDLREAVAGLIERCNAKLLRAQAP